jgi:hypothetical protein
LDKTLHRESYNSNGSNNNDNNNNDNNNSNNNNGQDNSLEMSLMGRKISILEEIIASDGFIRPTTIQPRGLKSKYTLNENGLNEFQLDVNNHDTPQHLLLQYHQQQHNPEIRLPYVVSDEGCYLGSHDNNDDDDGDCERGANDGGIVGEKKGDGIVKLN